MLVPMRMLSPRPDVDDELVHAPADLVRHLHAAAKPRATWRIAIEHEKILVRPDGGPVPFDGPGGVDALVRRLRGDPISVEPGGQLELAGPPLRSAFACAVRIERHLR